MKKKDDHKNSKWIETGKYLKRMPSLVSIFANFCGALFMTLYFTFFDNISVLGQGSSKDFIIPLIMFVFLVFVGTVFFRRWFRPLGKYIQQKSTCQDISEALLMIARRKILNLPFICAMGSAFNWVLAAIIMSIYSYFGNDFSQMPANEPWLYISRVFIGILMGGVVTCAMVFFLTEGFYRKVLPHFFPKGGLEKVKGVFHLHLRWRILITFVFASFIPMMDLAFLSYIKAKEMTGPDPEAVLSNLGLLIIFLLFVDLSVAVILSYLLSRLIVKPVTEMKNAMAKVEKGDLTASVKVSDNNELGVLAENFNQMTDGLRDRYQIRQSLSLAREVQQGLLPQKQPEIEGLDIGGRILYSDETGGDYYDYLYLDDPSGKKIGIVAGDVSGHGIPSALLMASTRAFIRQRLSLPGSIAQVITDVNYQFSRDVEDTGRFMTLFFLSIADEHGILEWVRAGHEPAILYDPFTDSFEELKGNGIALGIDGDFQYDEYERKGFNQGQIIILCTDGIWEAKNSAGEMFGKERIQNIIRANSEKSTKDMLDLLIESVEGHTGSGVPEDDITLVIVKRN